MFIDIIKVLIL